jgi:hypothetical protein
MAMRIVFIGKRIGVPPIEIAAEHVPTSKRMALDLAKRVAMMLDTEYYTETQILGKDDEVILRFNFYKQTYFNQDENKNFWLADV